MSRVDLGTFFSLLLLLLLSLGEHVRDVALRERVGRACFFFSFSKEVEVDK